MATNFINDDFPPPATLFQAVGIEEPSTEYIVETQVGIQWSQALQCIKGNVFARVAFEYQHWDREGETPFEASQNVNFTDVSVFSRSSHVDFTGLAFAVGFYR